MFTNEQKEEIVREYKEGSSAYVIAKKYNIKPHKIYYILKSMNVESRSNKENSRKYDYDKSYFKKIDTPEKAYWLGFIYADGYVSEQKDGSNKIFGIALAVKDIDHLRKFKKAIKATYPITTYNPSPNCYSTGEYSRIQICGDEIFNDLGKHGVVPHKTCVLKPPNIDKELIPHFIRGYNDGDGCITKATTSYAVKIVGTEDMLQFIQEFIELHDVAKIHKFYKRRHTDQVMLIDLRGNTQVKNFLDLIYKDSTVHLDRKYRKYLDLCHGTVERNGNITC